MVDAKSKASDICAAFFKAMDLDGNSYIEEAEVLKISCEAFGECEDAGKKRWAKMLADMDKDDDKKISEKEYSEWWMKDTSDKIQEDGTFVEGYAAFLIENLAKIQGS